MAPFAVLKGDDVFLVVALVAFWWIGAVIGGIDERRQKQQGSWSLARARSVRLDIVTLIARKVGKQVSSERARHLGAVRVAANDDLRRVVSKRARQVEPTGKALDNTAREFGLGSEQIVNR